MNRQFKEYIMRCVAAKWNAGHGVSLRLKDSHGEIKTSFGAGDTGMVWDAFGLSRGDDWSLAVGKKVIVWFNVNGVPARLKTYQNEFQTYEKLQPCPFCGNEPWGLFGPHPDIGYYWVECSHGEDTENVCGDWYFAGETKQETAEAWNKRHIKNQFLDLLRLSKTQLEECLQYVDWHSSKADKIRDVLDKLEKVL